MATKSRLKPNKDSRSALQLLQDKNVLTRQKIGLRHVVKADGTVEFIGHNIGHPYDNRHMPNFHPRVAQAHAVVQYNNARAELSATIGTQGYEGHVLDISKHFPENPLATQLLAAAQSNGGYSSSYAPTAYGDAVLVTVNRMHWLLRPYKASPDDIELCHDMLATPRDLIRTGDYAYIFFHEEPNQNDISILKMQWC
jgi:hypothetical protein